MTYYTYKTNKTHIACYEHCDNEIYAFCMPLSDLSVNSVFNFDHNKAIKVDNVYCLESQKHMFKNSTFTDIEVSNNPIVTKNISRYTVLKNPTDIIHTPNSDTNYTVTQKNQIVIIYDRFPDKQEFYVVNNILIAYLYQYKDEVNFELILQYYKQNHNIQTMKSTYNYKIYVSSYLKEVIEYITKEIKGIANYTITRSAKTIFINCENTVKNRAIIGDVLCDLINHYYNNVICLEVNLKTQNYVYTVTKNNDGFKMSIDLNFANSYKSVQSKIVDYCLLHKLIEVVRNKNVIDDEELNTHISKIFG